MPSQPTTYSPETRHTQHPTPNTQYQYPTNKEAYLDPIEIPINGVLDLHTFRPAEVKDLLDDYITACLEKEIYALRIIHGKGQGKLKKTVQSVLEKDRRVARFSDADATGGGWGATLVELKQR